ncbi:MAG: 3'(2'),5'-bisphosphate nucleotidase CysQ [Balneola sp.]
MIEHIKKIAKEAGQEILKYYDEEIEVESKTDDSPLTKADLAAHHYIVNELKKLTPEIPIISEESGIPDFDERKKWDRFWLVDPLDGTKEFIKKNGEFTVNIALIVQDKPTLGVVYVPAFDILYYGDNASGSFKQESNKSPVQLNTLPYDKSKKARIVVSRSHGDDSTKRKLEKIGIEVSEEVPSGSSLKFCLVAEGKADLYPRLGPTMEWDTAAADAVYRYSIKEGEKLSPLSYNKENFKNPYFLLGLNENINAEEL